MKALDAYILGKWVRVNTFSKKEIASTIDQILSDRLSEGLLVETSTNIIHLIKFLGKDKFEDTLLCFNLSSVIFGGHSLNTRILDKDPTTTLINREQLDALLQQKKDEFEGVFFGKASKAIIEELKGLKVDPLDKSAFETFGKKIREREVAYPILDTQESLTAPTDDGAGKEYSKPKFK